MFKFITLSNGRKVSAFYEADEEQVAKVAGSKFDFKELTEGSIVQKIAFVDADGNKIEIFKVPFNSDLETYHKTVTDNTIAESIEDLPAKFLPSIFIGNELGYYSADINSPFSSDDWVLYLDVIINNPSGQEAFVSQIGSSSYFYFRIDATNTRWFIQLYDGTNARRINALFTTLPLENRVYNFKIVQEKLSDVKLYENNILIGSDSTTFVNCLPGDVSLGMRDNTNIISDQVKIINSKLYTDLSESTLAFEYYPIGSINVYDVSGNNKHLLGNNISSVNKDYDLNGSLYLNENGYSLWEHATSDPIQVPFDINGNALSLTPGTDIPTGYTKTRDIVSGGNKWNLADGLINFANSGETAIDIYDRSNVIIHTVASRASIYYDAANPYIYHISEITNPVIYDTFFETAYKDRVFAKVQLDGSDLIRYDEQLNYTTQKSGADLLTVEEYCNIDSIYP